jgi:hypothetical protein
VLKSFIMEEFKNKLFNYEELPPEAIWDNIVQELDDRKVVELPLRNKTRRLKIMAIAAAASVAAIFLIFISVHKGHENRFIAHLPEARMDDLTQQQVKDSIALNNQILEKIINTPADKKLLASREVKLTGHAKKYITISGPEGQPVKISPKAATLILSADNEYPPRTVWNKKIEKWKQIMLSNTLSPTSTYLVDILQIAAGEENIE